MVFWGSKFQIRLEDSVEAMFLQAEVFFGTIIPNKFWKFYEGMVFRWMTGTVGTSNHDVQPPPPRARPLVLGGGRVGPTLRYIHHLAAIVFPHDGNYIIPSFRLQEAINFISHTVDGNQKFGKLTHQLRLGGW